MDFVALWKSRIVGLAVLFLIVSGCQKSSGPENNSGVAKSVSKTEAATKSLVDVTLALNWFPEAEHGGFYAALVHGYFAEEGMNVTIRPGGPGVPVLADVASGRVEFGVDNADKLLLLRAQQADVVAVMAPIQDSPRCIMVHKSEGITRLEQLAEKKPFRLAMNSGQPFAQFLMKKVNLDAVQVVAYPGNVVEFLAEPKYGQQAYSFSEPFDAERQGGDPVCLMLSEIGFNTYTSLLVTSAEVISQKPDLVENMARASIRGWKKYLSEPDATNEYIHMQNPQMGLEVLKFGVDVLKPLCFTETVPEDRLGEMSQERWETLASQMIESGSLKPEFGKPELAYTMRFLNQKPSTK